MDAADEAGGEVVYSYDGGEALPAPTPPSFVVSSLNNDNTNQHQMVGVDASAVEPTAAFEMFAGKLFYTPATISSAFGGAGASLPSSHYQRSETALERLARLQHEISELEQDFPTTTSTGTDADADAAASGLEADDLQEALLFSIQELKLRVARAAVMVPPQDQLTEKVASIANTILSSKSSSVATTTASSEAAVSAALTASLEQRLSRLERWIGTTSTTTSSNNSPTADISSSFSLQERLKALEDTLAKLDEKELEFKAKKAKVIRQDLEAASKARNKLLHQGGGSGGGGASAGVSGSGGAGGGIAGTTSTAALDAKMVAELHAQMVQLHGMTSHLPALTQRLQALSRQHQLAFVQSQQVQTIQDVTLALSSHVGQLEQSVSTLQQQLHQTAQQMTNNLQALDDKYQHLLGN